MPWNSAHILHYPTSFVYRLNACPNLVDISFIRNRVDIDIVLLETEVFVNIEGYLFVYKQVDHQIYKALSNP
jgi:hypothetical protein